MVLTFELLSNKFGKRLKMEKKGDRIPLASMEELNVEGSPQTQAKSTSGKESVSCIAYEMQLTADDDTASLSGSTKFETSKVKIISSQPIRDRYAQYNVFYFKSTYFLLKLIPK